MTSSFHQVSMVCIHIFVSLTISCKPCISCALHNTITYYKYRWQIIQLVFCLPVYNIVTVTSLLYCLCRYLQVLCLGVLIASVIAISNINDYFRGFPDDSTDADNRDKYRAVAGYLLSIGIAGLITQIIMTIIWGLYYGEVIISHFRIFGITVSINVYIMVYKQIKASNHSITTIYHSWYVWSGS